MKDKLWIVIIALYLITILIMSNPQFQDYMTAKEESKTDIVIEIPTVTRIPLGEFTLTAYCGCEICCGDWSGGNTAAGTKPTEGRTVGTDWFVLNKGLQIYIENVGLRTVEDKTAEWINDRYGGRIIDVYFTSHEDAIKFGKKKAKVYRCLH